jgi:thiol:disulfide interchange protein
VKEKKKALHSGTNSIFEFPLIQPINIQISMSRITKIALLTAFFTSTIVWAQVAFVPTNFSENLQSAKAEGKYLFVDAYTDWCGWCKVMDR